MEKDPVKAYKDLDFLTSVDARVVRILCEFLQPMQRFQRHQVRDTIVFFGSSRTRPPEEARAALQRVEEELKASPHPSPELLRRLEAAKETVRMSQYYADARELARRITEWSKSLDNGKRFIVCSGGGPGIMEAANRGAMEAGGPSIGLNISLPLMNQPSNHYITEDLNFEFHYFFMRKFWFVYLAKALVFFPGGFGTMDELMEVLTLVQTKKVQKKMPVVMYGPEYWREVLNFDAMVRWGTVPAEDLKLFRYAETVPEAFEYLKSELEKYYL